MGGDGAANARPKSTGVLPSGGGLVDTFGGGKGRGEAVVLTHHGGLTYGAIKTDFSLFSE